MITNHEVLYIRLLLYFIMIRITYSKGLIDTRVCNDLQGGPSKN